MKRPKKEPNWYGPELEPVFYYSDEENEQNLNWMPEGKVVSCRRHKRVF